MTNIFTIKEVCESLEDGNWIESKDQSKDGIRLIQTGNIKSGYFEDNPHKVRYISEKTFNRLNCKEVFEGDILISRLPDPVGRGCILPKLENRSITAVDCAIVKVKKNIINNKYLLYFLQSPQYQFQVDQKVTGTTRSRISRKNLGEINIPVPSLQEQEKIVEKLNIMLQTVDSKKRKNIQIQLEVEQLLASKMYTIFGDEQNKSTKFINFSDSVEVINKISVKKKDYLTSGKYPIVAQEKSLINGYTDNNQNIIESPNPLVGFGDHTKVIKFIDFPFIKGADGLKVFRVIEEILPKYFYYWLKSLNLSDLGYARHSKLLNNYKINVPSLKQQEKIVKKIDDLMIIKENIIVNYKNSNKNIETLKKSILYKEFSYE